MSRTWALESRENDTFEETWKTLKINPVNPEYYHANMRHVRLTARGSKAVLDCLNTVQTILLEIVRIHYRFLNITNSSFWQPMGRRGTSKRENYSRSNSAPPAKLPNSRKQEQKILSAEMVGEMDHLRLSGQTEKHIATLENLLQHMFLDILGKEPLVGGMAYLKDFVPFFRQMQGISPQTGTQRSQTTVDRHCDGAESIRNFGMERELISKSRRKRRKKPKVRPRKSGCPCAFAD